MKEAYIHLPAGSLDETHKWRLTHFRHLYHCTNCVRNIETREETSNCKFCNNELIEIVPTHPIEAYIKLRKLMYKCKKCNKYLIGTKETVKCMECGTDDIEFYDKMREFQRRSEKYRKGLKERREKYKKFREIKSQKSGFSGLRLRK